MSTFPLSVIVITKNEAANIAACLESVAFADEIIVVDSGSTDETVAICQAKGAKVLVTEDWPGFGVQKQRALAAASGIWVLSVDADERISPQLAKEIQAIVQQQPATTMPTGFLIPRRLYFLGKPIRFTCGKEKILRLVLRQHAYFDDKLVHEALHVDGKIAALKMAIQHYSFVDIESLITKMNRYTTLSAQAKQIKGKRGGLLRGLGHGFWTFVRHYILKAGFLDGARGFILSVYFAENSYYKYVKLPYLHNLH